ncbi:TAXI family TRAP transporter solute-binding subunit [Sulfurospirillum sp. T05]|uniref:TAXI family TRAP transporter solute-binding subunit n=1 Tax=Sulfurospirillum tamanense TaxID=2813362 RepID=A0ABS2WV10_9BACT|nr:TAXI family TRAP transporter solute-binding subunit [Sulfurospirillum tamanensis]MBN2965489.1 TAXI family TRAP transporter solute-binding subunit [Sulfurospirillum tamanensis]
MTLGKMFKLPTKVGKFAMAAVAIVALASGTVAQAQTQRLGFSGGPDGGTFQFFSNGVATLLSRSLPGVEVSNMASAGSVENLRRVNSKDADFGIVYSGDLYLGINGKLTNDANRYRNVHAVSYLYGAPAHLLVREDSGITDVAQLAGKKVAVGPAGSGAAASAQRFFESVGLWDKISPQYIGYSQGASAIGDRQIDGLWVFAGFPNASVIQATTSNKMRMLQVHEAAQKGTLGTDHPYYAPVTIPAGTYPGIDYDVVTVQDSALWVAGRHVDQELMYKAIGEVYSDKGLDFMRSLAKAAKAMTVESALSGIVTTVHKGAQKYWTEKGHSLTEAQK